MNMSNPSLSMDSANTTAIGFDANSIASSGAALTGLHDQILRNATILYPTHILSELKARRNNTLDPESLFKITTTRTPTLQSPSDPRALCCRVKAVLLFHTGIKDAPERLMESEALSDRVEALEALLVATEYELCRIFDKAAKPIEGEAAEKVPLEFEGVMAKVNRHALEANREQATFYFSGSESE